MGVLLGAKPRSESSEVLCGEAELHAGRRRRLGRYEARRNRLRHEESN